MVKLLSLAVMLLGVGAWAKRPQVYFDVSIGGAKPERITFVLYNDVVPGTAENFRALATGEKGFGYKNSLIYRSIPNLLTFGGDIVKNNGGGGRSFKNAPLDTESFKIGHTSAGILTMVNTGGTIDSKFAITSQPIEWINNNFVVVGHIIDGMNVFRAIEEVGSANGQMSKEVRIVNSGQIISARAP